MARVIVGTAGHIDHGKSTLVRALTGIDPDRLPEEKKRGITTDLGYAFLDDVAAIIDVPGHERLIRNMVAGAATIDYALLVIAADDGVMPQTSEHLQILRLLGVRQGAIVLTKADAVDPAWLDLVDEQIRAAVVGSFLESAPLFRVDSLSGRGVSELRAFLLSTLASLPARSPRGVFRLPVDRVFQVKGRGTVVTGTILSGRVQRDARLAVLPGGFDIRAKRLESHGHEQDELHAGQRAALNLLGDTGNLARGHTLTVPGGLTASTRIRVVLELLATAEPLKNRQRVRILIGTQEVIGRVQFLDRDDPRHLIANVLLEEEVVAVWSDRFVLRRYSPLETLGGGVVLEPATPRLRSRDLPRELEFSAALSAANLDQAIAAFLQFRGRSGINTAALARALGLTPYELHERAASHKVVQIGEILLSALRLEELRAALRERMTALHRQSPGTPGFSRSDLTAGAAADLPDVLFDYLLAGLIADGSIVQDNASYHEPQRRVVLTPAQQELHSRVAELLRTGGFAPPSSVVISEALARPRAEIEKVLVALERLGQARRLGLDLFFDATLFEHAVETVRAHFSQHPELSVSDASRLLSSSRKYVVPFLEYLDGKGITQRAENVRIPGRNLQNQTS